MRKCSLKSCQTRSKEGITRGPQFWCSQPCMISWSIEAGRKLRQKQAKEVKAQWRVEKAQYNAKNLPHQQKLTQHVFNEFIRLLDAGKLCPTCGEPLGTHYDAGHVRTVASCPQLRYDARACFGQCRPCNGSGTIRKRTRKTQEVVSELYREWVLKAKGQAYYDWLYGPHESKHYTCGDLIDLRAELAAEVSRLKSGLPPSKDWRAL